MLKKPYARFSVAAFLVLASILSLYILRLAAQQPSGRITRAIDDSARVTLAGSRPPRLQAASDLGPMDTATRLRGVSIAFSRSAAQEAALQKLIADQQNPASSLYHKWLTPDEFGARFGLSQSDLGKVQTWLQQRGFTISSISRSRNSIRFSGTVGQVESAFGTEIHNYRVGNENHFAPAREISIPAALSPVVLSVGNLSTFRPRPHVKKARPNFTSSISGNHFLTPKDIATMYDVDNPDINSSPSAAGGPNGAGQAIAIVGQSSIAISDIENFQNALGIPVKDPTLVLVPDTGAVQELSGDEAESDLDLEYSSSIATGAAVYFVYVGNDGNFSVWDSINYAIQTQIAPIISSSYGICEAALTPNDYSVLNGIMAQAAAQGQTIVAAAGDSGSTDCSGVSGLSAAQQQALGVDFPASSQFVTGMGGSEFSSADVAAGNTQFWQAANGTDVIGSAIQYIPEQVWNDDASTGVSSGGGGLSTLTAAQPWQNTNVPGITTAPSVRMVPDISLPASPVNVPFLFCSSDSGFTGVTGSCSSGFRDSSSQTLTLAGGTSFDAPMFAGLIALINQKENATGQGSVNSTLYSLAANSTTYGNAFHDITSGGNQCSAGASLCTGSATTKYPAGTGYDEASGLGSIDFANLLSAWPLSCTSCSAKAASRTTLSPASNAPAVGAIDAITITVAPASGSSTTPTGVLTILTDGGVSQGGSTSTLTLGSTGSSIFNFTPLATGSHTIVVLYPGDSNYAASNGSAVVDNQAFRVTASDVTVTAGKSGSSTVTITPQEGYTGTIQWKVPTLTNACLSISNTTVSDASPVTATLSIQTSSSACSSASLQRGLGDRTINQTEVAAVSSRHLHSARAMILSIGLLFACTVVAGPFSRRKLWTIVGVFILLAISLMAVGCGGGPSSVVPLPNNSGNVTPGTYNLTLTGTDTSDSAISGAATLTLTVN
ncbi:MAG TPA: protease pro-enzyme activation domain-containing protein [Terriglobales bacterium]|nr:protease pro-enzyme activation domain-containing protein [Terriglobales bacterium]